MNYKLPTDKVRQDLAWALTSPDLMSLDTNVACTPEASQLDRWLALEVHADRFAKYLAERNPKRLGIYFEVLWQYLLEQHTDFDLIARNLPVRTNGHTLGEFDFIYFCRQRQRHIHLETAVKFYLGIPGDGSSPSSWNQWIGPGTKDRLDLKLDKLLHKQTRLTQTPQGAELISGLGIDDIQPEICLKGYFFYPLDQPCHAPKDSNEHHLKGYWLTLGTLDQLADSGPWLLLPKEAWLASAHHIDSRSVMDFMALKKQLTGYFEQNRFPLMIASLAQCGEDFRERERYFITPDSWPD